MHLYLKFFGLALPSYGLMIATGIITANILAFFCLLQDKKDINDFLILEAGGFLGAVLGAKLLYLAVSWKTINWEQISLPTFNKLMQGGFVFYGGLIGGILALFFTGKLLHLSALQYLKKYIFLIPWMHGFGRLGCYMAGCCYGIPYDGPGCVIFPDNSLAPTGIKLFPVQLTEAVFLLIISVSLFFMWKKQLQDYTIPVYLIAYGILRFSLEFLRYDEERGFLCFFSTSQWISILLIIAGILFLWKMRFHKISHSAENLQQ